MFYRHRQTTPTFVGIRHGVHVGRRSHVSRPRFRPTPTPPPAAPAAAFPHGASSSVAASGGGGGCSVGAGALSAHLPSPASPPRPTALRQPVSRRITGAGGEAEGTGGAARRTAARQQHTGRGRCRVRMPGMAGTRQRAEEPAAPEPGAAMGMESRRRRLWLREGGEPLGPSSSGARWAERRSCVCVYVYMRAQHAQALPTQQQCLRRLLRRLDMLLR